MTQTRSTLFRVFNEIAIIDQLATAVLKRRLPDGLHPSQFALLSNLSRLGDGKTPADLASAFQVPKASMTNTLMQLSKRGLIEQRAHAQDGRKKLVFISDAGRAVFEKIIADMAEPLLQMTEGVDGVEALLPTLEELRRRLDSHRDI